MNIIKKVSVLVSICVLAACSSAERVDEFSSLVGCYFNTRDVPIFHINREGNFSFPNGHVAGRVTLRHVGHVSLVDFRPAVQLAADRGSIVVNSRTAAEYPAISSNLGIVIGVRPSSEGEPPEPLVRRDGSCS